MSLEYSKDGKSWTLTLSRFNGIQQGDTMLTGMGPYGVPDGSMIDIENGLFDQAAGLRRRGNLANSPGGANDLSTTTPNGFLAMSGPASLAAAVGPYSCANPSGPNLSTQNSVGAGTVVADPNNLLGINSKTPTVNGGMALIAGPTQSLSYITHSITVSCGATGAQYSTGTVTTVAGSNKVTGVGTTFTSSMVGQMFSINGTTSQCYVIDTVLSTTVIYLKDPVQDAAAGSTYLIANVYPYRCSALAGVWKDGTAGNSKSTVRAHVVCEYAGRIFVADTHEAVNNVLAEYEFSRFKSRIRWSGFIGSAEATTAAPTFQGMWAWHANGYADVNTKFGAIVALAPLKTGLMVFQELGATFVRGTPAFDTAAGLDTTVVFPNVKIAGGYAFDVNENGLFFVDQTRGPMVFTGVGAPKSIGQNNAPSSFVSGATAYVGSYKNWVVFAGSTADSTYSGTGFSFFGYHMPSGWWTRFKTTDSASTPLKWLQSDASGNLVGMIGKRVVNLSTMFDSAPTSSTDALGTGAFGFGFTTGKFGDGYHQLRPIRCYITYRTTGSPAGTLRVYTGQQESVSAATGSDTVSINAASTTFTASRGEFTVATTAPMLQAFFRDTGATAFDIVSVTIKGVVEGEIA